MKKLCKKLVGKNDDKKRKLAVMSVPRKKGCFDGIVWRKEGGKRAQLLIDERERGEKRGEELRKKE